MNPLDKIIMEAAGDIDKQYMSIFQVREKVIEQLPNADAVLEVVRLTAMLRLLDAQRKPVVHA